MYLGPVVAGGVREDLSVVVEGALGERLVQRLGALELGARVLVPEGVGAVGADRGQRAVHRVEGDVVHRVDILEAAAGGCGAVALEREVVLGVGRVHVLDGHAALHAAEREARRLLRLLVAEHGDAAVLVLQYNNTFALQYLFPFIYHNEITASSCVSSPMTSSHPPP